MDKVVSSVAALAIPGVAFQMAKSATGHAGAAGTTTALKALGPGGMAGGLATLGVVGLVSKEAVEFAFGAIYAAVVKELARRGESVDSMKERIDGYPVSRSLKLKLRESLEKHEGASAEAS